MDTLPNELLHNILLIYMRVANSSRLGHLATVNRQWQAVTERIICKSLAISPTDFENFDRYFNTNAERRRSLQHLYIKTGDFFRKSDPKLNTNETGSEISEEDCLSRDGSDDFSADEDDSVSQRDNARDDNTPEKRIAALKEEHDRFFLMMKQLWDVLYQWGNDLKLTSICLRVSSQSIYYFLGSEFQSSIASEHLPYDDWIDSTILSSMPSLHSVKELTQSWSQGMDVWPALVIASIARTLPSLEELELLADDDDREWPHIRKQLREGLARRLIDLPSSLRTIELKFDFSCILNHEIEPDNFMSKGIDTLSRALCQPSPHLTVLAISMNQISSELFWNSNYDLLGSYSVLWPNLKVIDIRTAFETAGGGYWMCSADDVRVRELSYNWCIGDFGDTVSSDEEDSDEEDPSWEKWGYWPTRLFRQCPDPAIFNDLAISIARAVNHMPRLTYLNLEFDSPHKIHILRELSPGFESYHGWAFYFRCSNESKFASTYLGLYRSYVDPGIDETEIDCPRSEWVFQCPYNQLQWEEPQESKHLWKKRFPGTAFDVVTLEFGGPVESMVWNRHRERRLIESSAGKCRYLFSGYELDD